MTRGQQLPLHDAPTQRLNRRFNRRVVDLECDFLPISFEFNSTQNVGIVSAHILNISSAGIYAELECEYAVGTRFQIRIPLYGTLRTFYGIVWRIDPSRSKEFPSMYGHGMKITTADQDTLSALNEFVNKTTDRIEAAPARQSYFTSLIRSWR